MLYLNGLTASVEPSTQAGRKRDFLALLNLGQGRDLLDAYAENRTSQNRNALAMHYSLCAQVVARQIHRGLTRDARRQVEMADVEQGAMSLLFQLVEKFDCSMGVPLSAFLVRRLRFALIDEYRRQGLMVRTARKNADRPVCVELEKGDRVVDSRPGPLAKMLEREGRKSLLQNVPREYRLLMILRFVHGMQLWQAAKRLNMTFEQAGQMEGECLKLLRGGNIQPPSPPSPGIDRPKREMRKKETPGVLPVELKRDKEFRGWFLRKVPWAYRKLVAYRYLRERDIEWTAGRLGICQDKARLLDRQVRPMMIKVVQEYQQGT